jgi:hypothetical protein
LMVEATAPIFALTASAIFSSLGLQDANSSAITAIHNQFLDTVTHFIKENLHGMYYHSSKPESGGLSQITI